MKKIPIFLALASCLVLCASRARADQLDDLISGMRKGVAVDADKRKEIIHTTGVAAYNSYCDSMANLYLQEVKESIADPDNNGGWPVRSFLTEGADPYVRGRLTKVLKDRFDKKPYSVLAYTLICPAIYTGDGKLVDQAESYLKDHDSFLYKMEQTQVDSYWRPYIKDVLAKEAPPPAAKP
jgi:hypothetical protein